MTIVDKTIALFFFFLRNKHTQGRRKWVTWPQLKNLNDVDFCHYGNLHDVLILVCKCMDLGKKVVLVLDLVKLTTMWASWPTLQCWREFSPTCLLEDEIMCISIAWGWNYMCISIIFLCFTNEWENGIL